MSATAPPIVAQDGDAIATARATHVQSVIDRLLANSAIYGTFLSGVRLESTGHGTVTTRLALSALHLNSKGGLHGAVSATIIDFTTGLAIAAWDGRTMTGASVDMHISYLSTAGDGDEVEIVSTADRVGGSLAFVTIRIAKVVKDDDGADSGERKLVTLGQHTKYVKGTAPP